MRWSSTMATLLALLLASPAAAAPKRRVIDRIVAIVDAECITKSELERFSAPMEARVAASATPQELSVRLITVRKEALTEMVDRRLLAKEALRMGLTVETADVDRALASVATQNAVDVPKLLAMAAEQGYDEARYREELRVQLIEGKLLFIEAPKRNADWATLSQEAKTEKLAATRASLVAELRGQAFVEVRL